MKILITRLSTIMLMIFNYQYLHCRCCKESNNNKTKSTRSTTATNPPFTPPATHPAKPDNQETKIKCVKNSKPKEINKATHKGQKLSVGEDIEVSITNINGKQTLIKFNSCVGYNDVEKRL